MIEGLIVFLVAAVCGYRLGRRRDRKLDPIEVPEGFVHRRYVEDPEHYDERGRYLWWGA